MKVRMLCCIAACAIVCLASGAAMATTSIESGIAPGAGEANWGNTSGQPGFINFEGLAQGSVLGQVLPGLKFVTTAGQDWLVGTWSSGNYNGKYPNGSYTSEGDAWAWLGESQGAGIIDFTGGNASYFSLLTSTYSGVMVDAYDEAGNLLETTGMAGGNTNTGTMTRLSISRETQDMSYVVVHDSGNYWVIDSIATDAAGVPNQSDPAVPEASTLMLALPGLASVAALRRRRA